MDILELKWPEGTFKAVKELAGNPLKEDTERNLSFWKAMGQMPEKGFYRQLTERFPDMLDLTDEERKGEEVLCWVYESKRATKEGLMNYRKRTLTSINLCENTRDMHNALCAWREKLLELDIKRVAIVKTNKDWEMYKKLMEYVLLDTGITVLAYFTQGRKESKPPTKHDRKGIAVRCHARHRKEEGK